MKKLLAFLAVIALAASVVPVMAAGPAPLPPVTTCVTVSENSNHGGDDWQLCAGSPITNLKVSNLSTRTNNLVNGCNTTVGTNPTWNDCISSIAYSGLPSGYKLRTYYHQNYSGPFNGCFDIDGSGGFNLNGFFNDSASSYRIEVGSC